MGDYLTFGKGGTCAMTTTTIKSFAKFAARLYSTAMTRQINIEIISDTVRTPFQNCYSSLSLPMVFRWQAPSRKSDRSSPNHQSQHGT